MSRPQPIPFYGELGSLNPVVVTERAARERGDELAAGLVGSFTLGAGQFCTKPGVVFIPSGSGFAEEVVARIGSSTPALMLNDRIRSGYGSNAAALAAHPAVEIIAGEVPTSSEGVVPLLLRTDAGAAILDPDALLE